MNKIAEPVSEPKPTKEEQAYNDARTLEGLADVKAGRVISVEQARENMKHYIAEQKRSS